MADGGYERVSRAEMLRKAKEAMADKRPEGNEHKVANSRGEDLSCSQADLPDKPILHLQGNEDCTFTLGQNTTVVKILIENCKRCKVRLPPCAKITTSVVEIWRCDEVEFHTEIEIGTLQADICSSLTASFARVEHLGQVVQAGVAELRLQFADQPELSTESGVAAIRESMCPDLAHDDRTTQFITRMVTPNPGAEKTLLTEEIIRLANDFPTTAREKAQHDRDIEAKHRALHSMGGELLAGVKGPLGDDHEKGLKDQLAKAAEVHQADLGAEATPEARAQYRRQLGTEQFKLGEYQQAAVHYTEAIDITPGEPALWANRAMCWLKMAHADKALADASECVRLDPTYTKAHFRRGVALYQLGRYREACEAYGAVLRAEPNNDKAKASLRLAERKLAMENPM